MFNFSEGFGFGLLGGSRNSCKPYGSRSGISARLGVREVQLLDNLGLPIPEEYGNLHAKWLPVISKALEDRIQRIKHLVSLPSLESGDPIFGCRRLRAPSPRNRRGFVVQS